MSNSNKRQKVNNDTTENPDKVADDTSKIDK